MSRGALPNLVVIGAMKSGTTSLHYYLGLHPQIEMSGTKELNFFCAARSWGKGVDWYRACYTTDRPIKGDTSPIYTTYPEHDGIPERMSALLPDVKLVYLVRDPVDRALSHYLHEVVAELERRPVEEALLAPGNPYLSRSRYAFQLERYLPFYPRSSILMLTHEELLKSRQQALSRVFSFVGVDAAFRHRRFGMRLHRTDLKRKKSALGHVVARTVPERLRLRIRRRLGPRLEHLLYLPLSQAVPRAGLDPAVRAEIAGQLKSDVARLRELTGERFEGWSV